MANALLASPKQQCSLNAHFSLQLMESWHSHWTCLHSEHLLMAGVLQVEAMAQLGGLLMIDPENEAAKNNFFFGGVDNCKWRKPVVPGDCLVSR